MVSKAQQRLAEKTKGLERPRETDAAADSAAGQAPAADSAAPTDVSAAPPPPTPRTSRYPGTMPGQLGAFRNEAQKYVEQIAERDALIAERDSTIEQLKNATDRVQTIPLALVDDSPYQPRLEYDPEEIDALAKTMAAATQADPIKVRKVGDRYELMGGHRRKRAALSLGWTEIDAIVEIRTDEQAELQTMLDDVANVKLSDYELAQMYDRALKKGYAKNRDKAAAMFGVSPSAVTGRLEMLALPKPILDILQDRPRLFSYSTASTIRDLVRDHPKSLDIIVKAVRRLYEEGASQSGIKSWVLLTIAQEGKRSRPKHEPRIVTKDGREIFSTKLNGNAVTVNIKTQDVDSGQFEKDLHSWLNAYANRDKES